MTEQAQYISGRTVQEQMDNLIKYVDDRSKTVAEEEAQRVLVPAENAKVAAEAAADRAVSSVGQFESRLDGVENGVAGNRSSIQTIDGEITDIYNDLTNVVRKVGEAGQVVANGLDLRGNNSVPDTVIGQNDSKPVNGKRVVEELSAYEPMVRNTGNQTISGIKNFIGYATGKHHGTEIYVTPNINDNTHWFKVCEWEATNSLFVLDIIGSLNNVSVSYARIITGHLSNTDILCAVINKGTNTGVKTNVKMTRSGNRCTLWIKSRAYHSAIVNHESTFGYGTWQELNLTGSGDTSLYDEPTSSLGVLTNLSEMV